LFSPAMGNQWVDVAAYPISGGGLAVYVKNIDMRKQLEHELETALATVRDQLAEKELLMLETHHRVKNSLQMVQSLLTLQSRNIADPEIAQKVAESAARVHIFGALHETLYRIADGTHVDIAAYLATLVDDLNAGIGATLTNRPIHLRSDALRWPAAEVSLIGLVLTELVTNALKYGSGRIDVAFDVNTDNDQVRLTVTDQGKSLDPDFQPTHTSGMGMRLISRLLRDRGGELSVDRSVPTTRFVVILKADIAQARATALPAQQV
jgi:two-component sensor histidine kinase